MALVRTAFMAAAAAAMAWNTGTRLALWKPASLWIRSLAGSCSLLCNFYALPRLPIADTSTLTNLYPLWIVLATALLARRSPTLAEWLGVLSGVLGIFLLQRPELEGDRLAMLVALGSSVSTCVAMLGLHKLRGVSPRAVVAHFGAVGAIVAGAVVSTRPASIWSAFLDPMTLALLLAVGISGTIGQAFLTRAYASGAPSRIAAIGLSQVAFAMILDVLIWGRTLPPITLLGFALVLGPTAWLTARGGRKAPDSIDETARSVNSPGSATVAS
ncbi:MAG: DMT family transporter [Isosphaeraceae bacterium]